MTTTNTPRPAEPTTGGPMVAPHAPPPVGAVVRQEFGGQEIAVRGEIGIQRAEAEARALVQARYIVARQFPRDLDDVRVRIMREVERPGFAAVAYYRKPIGKGVEGLSVRFAEAAARCMGNLLIEPETKYEDATKRLEKISITDLEANLTISLDVSIEKTVERTSLTDGRVAISVRKNSEGKLTYLVPATEDEMLGKVNSQVAKARRNLVLQVLPGDIADAAKARILAIRHGEVAKDPEGARRKVLDAFASLNVMPSDIKAYLGHDVASASPAEIQELRDLYAAIGAGEATWAEALADKTGGEAAPAEKKAGLDAAAEELEKRVAAQKAAAVAGCDHPGVPVNIPPGGSVTCERCGEVLQGEPLGREPGSDDDTPPPAKATVEDLKNLAAKAGPTDKPRARQGRLQE
jgi:hypothetical protein